MRRNGNARVNWADEITFVLIVIAVFGWAVLHR